MCVCGEGVVIIFTSLFIIGVLLAASVRDGGPPVEADRLGPPLTHLHSL